MRSKKKPSQNGEAQAAEIGIFTNFKNKGRAYCAAIWNLLWFKQDTTNEINNIMNSEGGMVRKYNVKKSNSHFTGKALRIQNQKGFSRARKKRCKTFKNVVKKPCQQFCSKMKKKHSKALGLKSQRYADDQCIKLDIVLKAPKQQLNRKKKRCLRNPKTKKPGKSLRKTIRWPAQKLSKKNNNSHMISKSSTSQVQKPGYKKKRKKSKIVFTNLMSKDNKSRVGSPKNISQATIIIPWSLINECIKKKKKRKLNKVMRKKIKKPGKKCHAKKISKQARKETQDLLKLFNELLLQSAATQS